MKTRAARHLQATLNLRASGLLYSGATLVVRGLTVVCSSLHVVFMAPTEVWFDQILYNVAGPDEHVYVRRSRSVDRRIVLNQLQRG